MFLSTRHESFGVAAFVLQEDVHDAWRSTVLPERYFPPIAGTDPSLGEHATFATNDVWNIGYGRALCRTTSHVVLDSVTSFVLERRQPTVNDVYLEMKKLYCHYQIHTVQDRLARERGVAFNSVPGQFVMAELISSGIIGGSKGCNYWIRSQNYKEKDRRMLLVGFATLLQPLYRLAYWDNICDVEEVVTGTVAKAAVDGLAILQAVRRGNQYVQQQAFAREATLLQS